MDLNSKAAVLFGGDGSDLLRTDPEFVRFFSSFAFDEVPRDVKIPQHDAALAVLASLMGSDSLSVFSRMLPPAMDDGVTPLEIREMIYQGAAYLGIGRVLPFLEAFSAAAQVDLPLEETATVTNQDRVLRGEDVQVEVFGENMRGFSKSGEPGARHINRWLSANCFGDYYTRGGLSLRLREMCTFCYISALGGCEPQLTSHAVGNMRIGNDRAYLIGVISACVPYIGYPRSLNAMKCVSKAEIQYQQALLREKAAGAAAKEEDAQ